MSMKLIKTTAGDESRRRRFEYWTGFWVLVVIVLLSIVAWHVVLRERLGPQPAAHPRVDLPTSDSPSRSPDPLSP